MPTYKEYNFYNVMDVIHEAKLSGVEVAYLKWEGDIHKIKVKYNRTTKEYALDINNVAVGADLTFSEVYVFIRSCIKEEEGE